MMGVLKRVPRTALTNRPQVRKQTKIWRCRRIRGMRYTPTTAMLRLSATTDRWKANTSRGGRRILPLVKMIHPTSVNDTFGARFYFTGFYSCWNVYASFSCFHQIYLIHWKTRLHVTTGNEKKTHRQNKMYALSLWGEELENDWEEIFKQPLNWQMSYG